MSTSVPKNVVQRELAKIIRRELANADDGDKRIERDEWGYLPGFIRQVAIKSGSRASINAIADKTQRKALGIWAQAPGKDRDTFNDSRVDAINRKNELLGSLTRRAFSAAKRVDTLAHVPRVSRLAPSDHLVKAVNRVSSAWNDGNISSGDLHLEIGKAALAGSRAEREKAFSDLARHLFAQAFEEREETELTTVPNSHALTPSKGLSALSSVVATDGFSYALAFRSGRKGLTSDIQSIAKSVASLDKLSVLKVGAAYEYAPNDKRRVSLFLLADTHTGRFASFYIREGAM